MRNKNFYGSKGAKRSLYRRWRRPSNQTTRRKSLLSVDSTIPSLAIHIRQRMKILRLKLGGDVVDFLSCLFEESVSNNLQENDDSEFVKPKGSRPWHYCCAHRVIPRRWFTNPGELRARLDSSDFQMELKMLWFLGIKYAIKAGQLPDDPERWPDEIHDATLNLEIVRRSKVLIYVISLPEPQSTPEVFFVGLVEDLTASNAESADGCRFSCYTLELGLADVKGRLPRTVLCGWSSDGIHLNYGNGPVPKVMAFVDAIERLRLCR